MPEVALVAFLTVTHVAGLTVDAIKALIFERMSLSTSTAAQLPL